MKYLLVFVSFISLMALGCGGASDDLTAKSAINPTLTYTSPYIGTLVYIPPGSFQRDSTSTNISVITTPFRLSEKEITQTQFNSVTGLSISGAWASVTNIPANSITWYHTLVFCNKLSMLENLTPVYTISGSTDPAIWGTVPTVSNSTWDGVTVNWTANGYRLPTRMEWYWAAMGATSGFGYSGSGVYTTGYMKTFAGSTGTNSIDNYVWYNSYAPMRNE